MTKRERVERLAKRGFVAGCCTFWLWLFVQLPHTREVEVVTMGAIPEDAVPSLVIACIPAIRVPPLNTHATMWTLIERDQEDKKVRAERLGPRSFRFVIRDPVLSPGHATCEEALITISDGKGNELDARRLDLPGSGGVHRVTLGDR